MTTGPGRPSPARVARLAVSLSSGVLFAVLAGAVLAKHGAPIGLDLPLHRWALRNRQAVGVSAAVALTTTGTGVPAYLLAALAGAAGRSGRAARWRGAALAAVALAAGQVIRVALVVGVDRPRPPAADWAYHAGGAAFPSGHTTTSALVAVIVCLAVRRGTVRPRPRAGWCAVALLWAAGVGGTRIYLGMHWPTDVLAGWLLAGCLALAALALPREG